MLLFVGLIVLLFCTVFVQTGCSDFVIRLGFGWGGLVAAGCRLVLVIDVLLWALVLVLLAWCFLFAGGVFGFVVLLGCSLFGFMLYCVWLVIW